MKKIISTVLAVSLSASVQASFKMGLGKAVAEEGSTLFTKAAAADSFHHTGDNVALSLPSCGNIAPYTVSPVEIPAISGIDPLGHVNPPGHTFPSDHIYFYLVPVDPAVPYGPRVTPNLLAPGNIHVSEISSSYTNGNPATIDYGIYFYACRELKSYFAHVKTLSAVVQSKLDSSGQNCMDYSTGGNSFHRCDASTDISLAAGDILGTVGGNAAAVDFGSYDYRTTPIAFISPARHSSDQVYTVCPLDYFEMSLKATLESHLGRWDGGVQRTAPPVCGDINYDIPGRASGDWYKVGAPDSPEDPHLALIHDNVYPDREDISMGTSVPGVTSIFLPFDPLASGTHNRDFAQVSADGQVYCYDTFFDPMGQPASPGYSVLISMPTQTTIRVQKFSLSSCGVGPWTMDSSSAEFQR